MTTTRDLSNPNARPAKAPSRLGVLSIHLDGRSCRLGCEFCYLDRRTRAAGAATPLDVEMLETVISRLDLDEVAVAVNEPAAATLRPVRAIVRAASARRIPVAVTTTAAVVEAERGLFEGVARVNLSIDPRKGVVAPRSLDAVAASVRAPGRQVALIVTLASERFAAALFDGDLARLLQLPHVDLVALHGLKPPPPWGDEAFWLASLARIGPLLERYLDRRLFLDCHVAARVLRTGACPGRPDVSPGNEFRCCVYQPAPDFVFDGADDLVARLADFVPPATCPFAGDASAL